MSKKILFVFIILIFSLQLQAQERKLNFYPNIAVDLGGAIPFPLSDIPDGAGGTPEPYPSLGIGAIYNHNDQWQFAVELNYHLIAFSATADVVSQPFKEGSTITYYTGYTETDVELRMVEFPFIAYYKLKKGRKIILGSYYSRILEARFETKGINGVYSPDKSVTDNANLPGPEITIPYDFNNDLDNHDYGILIGYSYDLSERLNLWGRLNVGFKSIFKKGFDNIDYEMYQVRINLGVSYTLFN